MDVGLRFVLLLEEFDLERTRCRDTFETMLKLILFGSETFLLE